MTSIGATQVEQSGTPTALARVRTDNCELRLLPRAAGNSKEIAGKWWLNRYLIHNIYIYILYIQYIIYICSIICVHDMYKWKSIARERKIHHTFWNGRKSLTPLNHEWFQEQNWCFRICEIYRPPSFSWPKQQAEHQFFWTETDGVLEKEGLKCPQNLPSGKLTYQWNVHIFQ